jgi:hypothetical protein
MRQPGLSNAAPGLCGRHSGRTSAPITRQSDGVRSPDLGQRACNCGSRSVVTREVASPSNRLSEAYYRHLAQRKKGPMRRDPRAFADWTWGIDELAGPLLATHEAHRLAIKTALHWEGVRGQRAIERKKNDLQWLQDQDVRWAAEQRAANEHAAVAIKMFKLLKKVRERCAVERRARADQRNVKFYVSRAWSEDDTEDE